MVDTDESVYGGHKVLSTTVHVVGVTSSFFVQEKRECKDGYYHGHTPKGALIEDAETGQMLVVDFELVKIVRGDK